MHKPRLAATLTSLAVATAIPVLAAETSRPDLKPFNVTVRVFDFRKGLDGEQDYVLPVDSPGGKPLPVAFTCIKVEPR